MNYKDVEIIRLFLPLYYLSKIFGVFPLVLVREPTPHRRPYRPWNRLQRNRVSDTGVDSKDDILEKFNSFKTYLRDTPKSNNVLKIFRADRVNSIYSYISVLVVILHGISAPFYVLHTTLPLQYNDSIFNMDFDEDDEEEVVQVTTLMPNTTAANVTFSHLEEIKKTVVHTEKRRFPARHSINRRHARYFDDQEEGEEKGEQRTQTEKPHFKIEQKRIKTPEGNDKAMKGAFIDLLTKRSLKEVSSKDGRNRTRIKKATEDIIKKNASMDVANETRARKLVYLFTHAPLDFPGIEMKEFNRSNPRLTRAVEQYQTAFNRPQNGSNRSFYWRNNMRRNRTTIFDNISGEFREVNLTRVTNYTAVSLMYDKETKQSLAMKIANPLMITVMCLASKFTALFFIPDNIDEFFSQLLIVDKILKYHPKFHFAQRRFVQHLLIYSFLLSVPINIHYFYTVIEVNNEFGVMWCCILIYTNLASFLLDLHFIYFNYLLYVRYRYINRQIKTSFSKYGQNSVVVFHNFLIYDFLEVLRECHKKLSDLLKLLNYIYQVHLLLALSTCFIKLLFNIYFAMFGYVIGTAVPHSEKESMELFRTVLWSMYYAMRFLCVILSADITAQQARKTSVILANVQNRHLDSLTKEEISIFETNVSSQNLKYTAAGFFSLNSHLITSAIATGTTYLVILVQFHGAKL